MFLSLFIRSVILLFVINFLKRNVANMRIIFAIKCLSSHYNKQIERVNSLFVEKHGFLDGNFNTLDFDAFKLK